MPPARKDAIPLKVPEDLKKRFVTVVTPKWTLADTELIIVSDSYITVRGRKHLPPYQDMVMIPWSFIESVGYSEV